MRNPQRTASTASALMIGLALVTLVSVLAVRAEDDVQQRRRLGLQGRLRAHRDRQLLPDLRSRRSKLWRKVPGVKVVSGVRAGDGKAFGGRINVTGVPRDISKVIVVNWEHGSQATAWRSSARTVRSSTRRTRRPSTCRSARPSRSRCRPARRCTCTLKGIFAPPKGGSPYGDVTISQQRFDAEYQNPQNIFAFVDMAGGVTAANTATLTNALEPFPDAKIATASEFKKNQEQGINTLLNLLYVLLSLSILISLFGIVNTLVLTVFERTRELGMLRAVGMTRRQVRRMIRHESIVTALIGAALGIPVGVVLALMVGKAINYPAFTIPWGTLIVFVIAAILAGLVAAIIPARRAGRLNVLQALQYE